MLASDDVSRDTTTCGPYTERWQELARGHIRLLTIAAERRGAAQLCAHAVAMGITVSLGHQLATADDIDACAAAGATLLTHLGNGCPAMIDRHRNHLWPALAEERLSAMLISDGQHLPPAAISTFLRAKGLARVCAKSCGCRERLAMH